MNDTCDHGGEIGAGCPFCAKAPPASSHYSRNLGTRVVDMILHCPACGFQHIDCADDEAGEPSNKPMPPRRLTAEPWGNPPHRSHLCHDCGHIWRPSDAHTNGVARIRSHGVNDSPPVKPAIWAA